MDLEKSVLLGVRKVLPGLGRNLIMIRDHTEMPIPLLQLL